MQIRIKVIRKLHEPTRQDDITRVLRNIHQRPQIREKHLWVGKAAGAGGRYAKFTVAVAFNSAVDEDCGSSKGRISASSKKEDGE